ncbi:PD-(D/E)XK nuclease family protein [Barnesiella viscericola]|uniref:PD-(D/E)XK nuclease family protein n=1 Tax=Barnesiella viscericola TaxID=397865 RepID=UPI00320A7A0F
MKEERVVEIFDLLEGIKEKAVSEVKYLFDIVETVEKVKEKWLPRLPYHLNIIDELHINENGHSRILTKLLQYKSESGKYEFLESLLAYIVANRDCIDFGNIKIEKPQITQEKCRIDMWVRDKDYAIIFENKVYNARDREHQLSKYINRTKQCNYREEQIFVVYLSSWGQEPEEQSWNKYKDAFTSRYVNLSFRDDIVNWLKEYVIPNIRDKDFYLNSAVLQYIDYLEGIYHKRTIHKEMNMEIRKIIEERLKLDKCLDNSEKVRFLQSKIEDIDEIRQQIEELQNEYRNKIFASWREEVANRFPQYRHTSPEDETHVGVIMEIEGIEIWAYIYENNQLYCQVEVAGDLPKRKRNIKKSWVYRGLEDLLPQEQADAIWKYFDYNDFEGAFNCFLQVVEKCKQEIERENRADVESESESVE